MSSLMIRCKWRAPRNQSKVWRRHKALNKSQILFKPVWTILILPEPRLIHSTIASNPTRTSRRSPASSNRESQAQKRQWTHCKNKKDLPCKLLTTLRTPYSKPTTQSPRSKLTWWPKKQGISLLKLLIEVASVLLTQPKSSPKMESRPHKKVSLEILLITSTASHLKIMMISKTC